MKKFKHSFLAVLVLGVLTIPAFALAHGGVDDGDEATGVTNSVIHEEQAGGFSLSTPWSPKWWMLMGVSLVLMGALSMYIDKYLKVE